MWDVNLIRWMTIEALYRCYGDEVYKTCLFYTKDEHVSNDLTQKAFLSYFDHLDRIRPGRIRPYLIRTARNMAFNWLRDFKRLRKGWIEDLNDEDLSIYSVEDMYIREQDARLAWELSNSILTELYQKNERWYDVVVMAYYLDIPQEEIAKRMGVDIDVIYSRLYRAKQWIRKNYKEDYEKYLKAIQG